jgi:hypothetical protein
VSPAAKIRGIFGGRVSVAALDEDQRHRRKIARHRRHPEAIVKMVASPGVADVEQALVGPMFFRNQVADGGLDGGAPFSAANVA